MAWRAIQDTVGQSESLAELSDLAERVYWRLLAHSDPWGRLDARPRKLRARCWPMLGFSDEQAGYALIELEAVGRIVVYEKAGEVVVQIVDFEKNQPREAFRKRSGTSPYPDPPRGVRPTDGLVATVFRIRRQDPLFPADSGPLPERVGEFPEEVRPRREGEEKREDLKTSIRPSDGPQTGRTDGAEDDDPEPTLGTSQPGSAVELLNRLTAQEAT